MTYKITIEKQAIKFLKEIKNKSDYTKITSVIEDLANNPMPFGSEKLKGKDGYRIRQGNYRILYDIEHDIITVIVTKIGHRKDVYK